jgi:hypothetical protein
LPNRAYQRTRGGTPIWLVRPGLLCCGVLRPGLIDQVEGSSAAPAECGEPGVGDDLPNRSLAGPRSEGVAA